MFSIPYACYQKLGKSQEYWQTGTEQEQAKKSEQALLIFVSLLAVDIITTLAFIIAGSCLVHSSSRICGGILGTGLVNAGLVLGIIFILNALKTSPPKKKASAECC